MTTHQLTIATSTVWVIFAAVLVMRLTACSRLASTRTATSS